MLTEITCRKDIEFLLTRFYEKSFADDVIGYIFTEVAHLDLDAHLPVITNFWEDLLLGSHHYNGNPVKVHQQLDKLSELNERQFDRWLWLWQITVDELFSGDAADEAKKRAENIAGVMLAKIMQNR
jgi:hemoglobin